MIEIQNLSKSFDEIKALDNVSINVKRGEIVGIVGLSGAGKSTLVRCINRLEEPSGGTIFIKDQNILALNRKELRDMRKKIGMIFQHFNLLYSRTVLGNILFPMEIAGTSRNERIKRADELLQLVELADKREVYPAQLSGGQKQRVGIARALANDPDVLLCDEATSSLDPKTTKSILRLLKRINEQMGLTIMMITHEMEVIKEICHRVVVIENGAVIESGKVVDIFAAPKHPTTKSFVEAVHPELTEDLLVPREGGNIFRLFFKGTQANKPVLSQMIKKYDIEANIFQGTIDNIQGLLTGNLIVEFIGGDDSVNGAIDFLEQNGVVCEVISK